jgi:predicted nuclease of predicted toxin-antitoxin system
MRLLANENVPLSSVRMLRAAGHDTAAVAEDLPGSTDSQVLARASAEGRIIVTFDRDYGALIYRLGLTPPAGVIYLWFQPVAAEEPAQRLLALFDVPGRQLDGMFTVLEAEHLRQRPLP